MRMFKAQENVSGKKFKTQHHTVTEIKLLRIIMDYSRDQNQPHKVNKEVMCSGKCDMIGVCCALGYVYTMFHWVSSRLSCCMTLEDLRQDSVMASPEA